MRSSTLGAIGLTVMLSACAAEQQMMKEDLGPLAQYPGVQQQIKNMYDNNATEDDWTCDLVQMNAITRARTVSETPRTASSPRSSRTPRSSTSRTGVSGLPSGFSGRTSQGVTSGTSVPSMRLTVSPMRMASSAEALSGARPSKCALRLVRPFFGSEA